MSKGIYFLEQNSGIVSDFEGYFFLKNEYALVGSSNSINRGVTEILSNPSVQIIVISENLIDGNCITALSKLTTSQAMKIVTLNAPNEMLQNDLRKYGVKIIIKPYGFAELDRAIKSGIASPNTQAQVPPQTQSQPRPQVQINERLQEPVVDNPFIIQGAKYANESPDDIKERFRRIRAEAPVEERKERLIPQQVFAIHNQKGGVGKTTTTKELAIAIRRFGIKKNGVIKQPEVCIVDCDLDACGDITHMMNLPARKNIAVWHNDLKVEQTRIEAKTGKKEPLSSIRFTEQQIKQSYLVRHESGVWVLPAPTVRIESTKIYSDAIKAIIQNLRACNFDVILIDTGPNILAYSIAALLEADKILAVSTCEISSVNRLDSLIKDLLAYKEFERRLDKFKLIINMFDNRGNILPKEVAEVLNIELVGVIPKFDEMSNINNEAYSSFDNKIAKDKRANDIYSDSINKIARKITGIDSMQSQQFRTNQIPNQVPMQNYNPNPVQNYNPNFNPNQQPTKKGFWARLFGR